MRTKIEPSVQSSVPPIVRDLVQAVYEYISPDMDGWTREETCEAVLDAGRLEEMLDEFSRNPIQRPCWANLAEAKAALAAFRALPYDEKMGFVERVTL